MKELFFFDGTNVSNSQLKEAAAISENFFKTNLDKTQMKSDCKLFLKISKLFPEFIEVIFDGKSVVGSSIFLPCTKKLEKLFLSKKITEAQLASRILKKVNYKNFECIYWAESSIIKKYQHHELFMVTTENVLRKVHLLKKKKLPVFFWAWSKEGKIAGKIVFDELEVKERFIE
ncbi:MAG: hypothetical protein WCW13_00375 [archaeon]|jgi:hypothetical protein